MCLSSDFSKCSLRCKYYMQNTMNTNPKGYCDSNHTNGDVVSRKLTSSAYTSRKWYNNKKDCLDNNFAWYEVKHSDILAFGNETFVCAKTQFSRVNQLGELKYHATSY